MDDNRKVGIQRIDEAQFLSLKDEWNDLLARSLSDNLFLRWEWIHTWWEIFKKQRILLILTVRQNDRLVGLAPFYIEPAIFPKARRLQFCSDELSPDYMDIIVEKGLETSVTQEIVRYIKQHAHEWDILIVDSLRADSTLLACPTAFEGIAHTAENSFDCPHLVIQGSFEDYIKSRPNLTGRFALEKKIKALLQKHAITHVIVNDSATLEKGIDDLFQLHKKRADSMGLETNFAAASIKQFHRVLAGLLLEKGFLTLYLLYDGATAVSAHYAFFYKKKYYFYQSGFNPLYKKYSVGMVSAYLMIQKAFADGAVEYDFLKGDESYKFLWANAVRKEVRLTAYSPLWRGALVRSTDGLISLLKRLKRASTKALSGPPKAAVSEQK